MIAKGKPCSSYTRPAAEVDLLLDGHRAWITHNQEVGGTGGS